jgi:hypothetical protein
MVPSRMRDLMRRAVVAFSVRSRQRKARLLVGLVEQWKSETVLIVGTGGMRANTPNEGIIERAIGGRATIVGALDIRPRSLPWPTVVGDGRFLPCRSDAVDFVVSNAVIEHVGDERSQRDLVAEHLRVGRAWAITTPNRWFPVESHTSAVLRHWSPAWRDKRREFTRLLSRREFRAVLPPGTPIVGKPWSASFTAYGRADCA